MHEIRQCKLQGWQLPGPQKVCIIIAFYRFWAIILPTFGGLGRGQTQGSGLQLKQEAQDEGSGRPCQGARELSSALLELPGPQKYVELWPFNGFGPLFYLLWGV